jgi:hypothetical protein
MNSLMLRVPLCVNVLLSACLWAGLSLAVERSSFKAARTPVIRGGEKAQAIVADISGAKDLYLVASIGGDTYNSDQAIWAEPKLFDKDGRSVDLTTVKPADASVGWGAFHVNVAHSGSPLSIGGVTVAKGFYAHAPSSLHFKLDGNYTRFEASVGIATASGKNGSVEFVVTNAAPNLPKPDPKPQPAAVTQKLSPADKAPHQFNAAAAQKLLAQGIGKLLFVRRFTLTNSHIYTEHIDSRWTPGGELCVLDLKTGAVTELVPALNGGVFNRFDLSFDAKTIIFDYKKSAKEGYRIYEIGLDGKGLRQLTFPEADDEELAKRYGYGTNDMQPCYLPDGSIIFTSTRCRTSTLCNSADVYTTTVLHRMDADGKNIRQLSNNCVSEFSPAVMPDGRVLYMRWEYNRKGAGAVKGLWAMQPDGAAASEVYGNLIVDPESMLYGRPVPGTPDKILFLGCSHWGPNNGVGTVILLDTKQDTASRDAMTLITRDVDARTHGGYSFLVDGKWVDEKTGTLGRLFKDPYPLSEKLFLAALKPKGLPWSDPKGYELCLLDEQGSATTLYRDEEISCWHPYPIRTRASPPQPSVPVNPKLAAQKMAQCLVADVYAGLGNVPRGSVKYIRILEQTPRPWTARNTWPGDRQSMAHTALGPNLLGMQAQYGIVPVEDDGSANFLVPADRNIYFQILDERYLAIQTERTYVNYQPGESRSCVGCHERARAGAVVQSLSVSKALKRPPSVPAAQPGETAGKKVFDYERQIQPIWNAHCVRCHDEKAAVGLNLTGSPTELYNVSYENLLAFGIGKARKARLPLVGLQVDENDVRAYVEYAPPYFFGAYTSILAAMFGTFEPHFDSYKAQAPALAERVKTLREKHKEVKLTSAEFVRIVNWLDASCQYFPSYWGQKNLTHKASPFFRPDVAFDDAVGAQWPASLRALYDPQAQQKP